VDIIKKIAADANVTCEAIATRGVHPYEEILATASDKHCDVIWIASHGRRGLDKLLLGSETQRVLAHATIPIIVYR
jgi:nucleotide-binding universal stress UspA family protein